MFTDFYHGDQKNIKLEIKDNKTNTPIDISQWVFEIIIRPSIYTPIKQSPIVKKFYPGDHIDDDPHNGIVHLELSSNETQKLMPNKPYFITLQYYNGTEVFTLAETRVRVRGSKI